MLRLITSVSTVLLIAKIFIIAVYLTFLLVMANRLSIMLSGSRSIISLSKHEMLFCDTSPCGFLQQLKNMLPSETVMERTSRCLAGLKMWPLIQGIGYFFLIPGASLSGCLRLRETILTHWEAEDRGRESLMVHRR